MAYSKEVRQHAESLYVTEGMKYVQIAEATGVSERQVKTWGVQGNWREKRREHRSEAGDPKRDLSILRGRLFARPLRPMTSKPSSHSPGWRRRRRAGGSTMSSPRGLCVRRKNGRSNPPVKESRRCVRLSASSSPACAPGLTN